MFHEHEDRTESIALIVAPSALIRLVVRSGLRLVLHACHMAAAHMHVHERHELGGHDDEGAHHVVVFMLEDVTVVHVAAAEDLEADDDIDDFLRVDPNGLLEAALVVVEPVWDAVVEVVADAHRCARAGRADPAFGDLYCGPLSIEDLE